MNAENARNEIFLIAKQAWEGLTGVGPIIYSDVTGAMPNDAVWARATIRHATGGQSSLADYDGKRQFTATGTVWVQVFAPFGDGLTNCYRAASAILIAYSEARNGQVWYRKPRLVEVGANGGFEQINVMIDFTYDETR